MTAGRPPDFGANLRFVLTWQDSTVLLGLSATITDCGQHAGCRMYTSSSEPAGPTRRRIVTDGTRGKTYRVEVAGDPSRAADYHLSVTWERICER